MTYSTPKPLPDTPSSPVLRRLTTDSNVLFSTFVQRIVDEGGLDSSWIDVIKSTLVDFGEYLESGQIVTGLRATRKAQSHARAFAYATAREHRVKERDRLKESKAGKGKGNDKDKEQDMEDVEASAISEKIDVKLKQIHALTSIVTPTSPDSPKHLFLTTSTLSDTLPDQDMDFDIIPVAQACTFDAGTFSFPFYDDDDSRHGQGGTVISGLDNWFPEYLEASPQIVGGTFTFRNLVPGSMYESLTTILKLSIYTYISLILEQHLLSNFHVMLQYPKPRPLLPASTPLTHSVTLSPPSRKSRSTKSSSGLWSFLSKKTEGIIHRVTGANSEGVDGALLRTSSIDIGSVLMSSKPSWRAQRVSNQDAGPARMVDETDSASTIKAPRTRVAEEEERRDRERFGPFTSTVRRVQDQNCILSTSPKVIFPLPPLIARLAQREEEQRSRHVSTGSESSLWSSISSMTIPVPGSVQGGPPNLRLTGVEKTGLGSVLGWEGLEARGRGMAGIRSFVRHQGLVALYAEHTQIGEEMFPCGRPKWVATRYWSRRPAADADHDQTLGEFVERLCDTTTTKERCPTEGCNTPRGGHCMSWTCGGVRVRATVKGNADAPDGGDDVEIWQTCVVCCKTTGKAKMSSGTYLFSLAKYLELLIWSPIITSISLCEHITSPSPLTPQAGEPPLSGSRFHILRHFAHKHHILTFALMPIHNDIYELRLPRFQIISGSIPREERNLSGARKKREGEEERLMLGTEIDAWWQDIHVRLDKLDDYLEAEAVEAMANKNLPPLPASDDEGSEDEVAPSRSRSPKRPPTSRSISFAHSTTESLSSLLPESIKMNRPPAPYPPGLPISIRQSRKLLVQLRASFDNTENTLRKQVQDTPVSSLNDVRRAFRCSARGICKRLAAWQMKHMPGAPVNMLGDVTCTEPEWWGVTCHTVPGGRVVVREGEWGSVIAFTLSSLDYQRELANFNAIPPLASSPALSVDLEPHLPTPNATIKPTKSPAKRPDPDESDTTCWEESESWTAVISRREHPREVSSLLSLRDVLRTKRSFDGSSLGSRFSGSLSRGVANVTPPSAWAQPQVQVNLQSADGHVSQFADAAEIVEKVLECKYHMQHPHTASDLDYNFATLDSGDVTPTPSSFIEKRIHRGGASSLISIDNPAENQLDGQGFVPIMAPKPVVPTIATTVSGSPGHQDTHTNSSSFSGALSNAMRYFLSSGSSSPSRGPSPVQQGPHHALLTRDTVSSIDDRPHIKYDWTIGRRLKFSCTVYYAKQFDMLRKRCGVDNIVIKSLERSENWTAVGGKSKSNFWKSSDDRFIIKTLVDAWNVADLQVLIDLAPSYFRYIDSTANKASVLAKLMGFYTVEVKNLETGSVQAKHDLLVMENLFYDQKVARAFDLKGIQSRRVKLTNDGTQRRTLLDGEWIEGQHRAPLLIQPHSGHILHEAVRADAEFLAKNNIMDYSLLLGIDEERHEISCGLVDTIGSYTFAKTLEYKAKQNLNSGKGKEVTVIPPAEYQTRFVNSIENYFHTCPDKWTKPSHYIDRTRAGDLPSVV